MSVVNLILISLDSIAATGIDHNEQYPCNTGITHGYGLEALEATWISLLGRIPSFDMSFIKTLARYHLHSTWNKCSAIRLRSTIKPANVNSQQNVLLLQWMLPFCDGITQHLTPVLRGFSKHHRSGFAFDCNEQAIFGLIFSEKRCTLESCKYGIIVMNLHPCY